MTGPEFLGAMAAELAWLDGRQDGVNGQLAILFCLRNRVAAGHEGGDLGRIIQAEFINRFASYKDFMNIPDVRDPSFQATLENVAGVLDNSIVDRLTAGALYWGDNKFGKREKVAQVGTLTLWR